MVAVLLLFSNASAQRIGRFDTVISFMDTTRKLACFVPEDYDPAKAYRLLIGLHGMGDNAVNYRNALINSLRWSTHFPNTIFICPSPETNTADFYSFAGSEEIIQTSIDFAMSTYHIDTSNVLLQGFSLGGRAALRYGLEHPEKFAGLLLNTPAIQGVKNAMNRQPQYQYKYENADLLPIYITHGGTDVLYTAPIDSAVKQMILQNGKVLFNYLPKLGHSIPAFSQMSDVLQFFETPAMRSTDIELVEILAPERACNSVLWPYLLIRNVGSTPTSEISIEYGGNGSFASKMTITEPLAPFEHRYVGLPSVAVSEGKNSISARVFSVNATTDTAMGNNTASDTVEVSLSSRPLPYIESFSGSFPPAGWTHARSGDYISGFDIDGETGSDQPGSMTAFNTIFIFDNLGHQDAILTPSLDLTSIDQPVLVFDRAFNFHRYTPPYFTDTVDFADTLEILISTNCGGSWQSLWKKGGSDLATFAEPIMNPLNLNQDFISPEPQDWRTERIELNDFASATSAVVKFNYISALGGHLYIDNVRFQSVSSVNAAAPLASYQIYPNPAQDMIQIEGTVDNAEILVLDVMGREVLKAVDNANSIDVSTLTPGSYMLKITERGSTRFEKLMIQR
jgi:predicted esterase